MAWRAYRIGVAAVVCAVLAVAGCGGSGGTGGTGGPDVPAALAGTSAQVPLKVLSSHNATIALLPVMIDGKGPFVFALDTGSSTSLVDSSVAREIGLAPHGQHTIDGVACTATVHRVKITDWSTGTLRLPPDTVAVTNLAAGGGGLDGLLGSDVLSQYGTVTIDYAHGQLSVGKAAGEHAEDTVRVGLKIVRASTGATLALAPVTIDGHGPYTFALDTGAATSTLGLLVARKLDLPLHRTGTTVTGVACSTDVQQTRLAHWDVGSLALPASQVDVVKFVNAHGEGLQGLLGSNILARFGTITVDYADGQLRLPANSVARADTSAPAAAASGGRLAPKPLDLSLARTLQPSLSG